MATTNLRDTYERIEMKVSDICDINKSNVNFTKDQLVEYLDTGSLTEGVIDSLAKVRYGDAPSRAQRAVEKDTILYSTVRPNLKHYGIVAEYNPNIVVSTGFTTIDVKENKKEEIDAHFLYYLMTQQWVTKHLHTIAQSSVSSYPSISPSDIGNLEFEFPFIATQRRIASVLSNIDKKIALNRQINQNLEALAKQLYDYWFVQFDFPDENGKPYKSSGGAMVYNEQLKREIPKGWEYFTTDKLTNVITGKEDANFSVPNGAYPFFTCSRENLRCATPAFAGKAILIAGNGDFNVKHYNGTFNAYQRTYVLIPKDSKYYGVLYFAALERIDLFKAKSNGSIIKFITKGDVENIGVYDCHKPEIYKQINTLIEAIETNECEIASLIKQRNELLPLLMNGQVNFDLSAC